MIQHLKTLEKKGTAIWPSQQSLGCTDDEDLGLAKLLWQGNSSVRYPLFGRRRCAKQAHNLVIFHFPSRSWGPSPHFYSPNSREFSFVTTAHICAYFLLWLSLYPDVAGCTISGILSNASRRRLPVLFLNSVFPKLHWLVLAQTYDERPLFTHSLAWVIRQVSSRMISSFNANLCRVFYELSYCSARLFSKIWWIFYWLPKWWTQLRSSLRSCPDTILK